jgi:hypothetical protein
MGSTTVPIYLLGGVQLLSLGVIGEYVSKIYAETKGRPRYLIEPDGKLMRILAQAKRKTLPGRALTIDSSI